MAKLNIQAGMILMPDMVFRNYLEEYAEDMHMEQEWIEWWMNKNHLMVKENLTSKSGVWAVAPIDHPITLPLVREDIIVSMYYSNFLYSSSI